MLGAWQCTLGSTVQKSHQNRSLCQFWVRVGLSSGSNVTEASVPCGSGMYTVLEATPSVSGIDVAQETGQPIQQSKRLSATFHNLCLSSDNTLSHNFQCLKEFTYFVHLLDCNIYKYHTCLCVVVWPLCLGNQTSRQQNTHFCLVAGQRKSTFIRVKMQHHPQ